MKGWLAQVTRLMLPSSEKSNTYRSPHSGYEELGVFGTWSSILMDDFKNVIHSYPLTIGESVPRRTGRKARSIPLYREFQKTVPRASGPSSDMQAAAAPCKAFMTLQPARRGVTVVHCIEPRSDRDHTQSDAKEHGISLEVLRLRAMTIRQFLRESGFASFRSLLRWGAVGGDITETVRAWMPWRCPPLQHEQRRKAQGIDKLTNPATSATSLKNRDVEMPGGITFRGSAQRRIKSLYDVRSICRTCLKIQDAVLIRDAFSPTRLMLANSTNTTMTADRSRERHEKSCRSGPTTERGCTRDPQSAC